MSAHQQPGPQPAQPTPPRGGGARRLGTGAVAAIAAVSFAVAGVGGYLIGHHNGKDSGTTAGYSDGVAVGRAQETARYQPGQAGYLAIYAKGKAAGEAAGQAQGQQSGEAQGQKVGFDQGQKVGIQSGDSEGVKQGAAAVLGGFTTWADGAFYVVTMAAGTDPGVPYTVSSRTQLQPGTSYQICSDANGGASQLCQSPVTPTG
jgi:hypothetical protein